MIGRSNRRRLMLAAAALTSLRALAQHAAADIVNVTRNGNAFVSGQALAFTPQGVILQNESYNVPRSDQTGLGPIGFTFGSSITDVAGATANSFVTENGTVTLDLATGNVVVTSSGTANAGAGQSPPTSTRITTSNASASAGFNFGFTLTNRNYDYQIDLGNVGVNAPVGADTTAFIGLAGPSGFSESLSSDEPPALRGSLTGTLTPGTYGMSGSVDAAASMGSSSSSYGFTLTLTPSAPEFHWTNAGGGTFATDSNWDPRHVPGTSDAAVFDAPGAYTVQLDQDAANQKVRANGSGVDVAIDLAGHTYTVDNLLVGGQAGDSVHLSFQDSGGIVVAARGRGAAAAPITLNVPGNMSVKGGGELDVAVPTSSGSVNVDGGGSLTASGANAQWLMQNLLLGTTGMATFNVSNKATVTTTFANVGVGSTAAATVSGDATTWTSDRMVIGGQGTGNLSVIGFGAVHADNVVAGASAGGTGTIIVDSGEGQTITALSVLFQDGAAGSLVIGDQGAGHLIVRKVGDVQAEGTLEVGRSGGGSGDITLTDPSSIIHAESLNVGTLGTGTVNVSNGAILATSEALAGRSIIGEHGTVSLSSAAIWNARTSLEVDGRLQIDSSSHVNVGTGFGTAGELTISLGGTLSGAGTISVGKVVLAGGATSFSGGILKPGHSPGTLTINGDLEQDPGGVVKIEVAGTQPGQFDVLDVTDNATFAGDLLLSFQDGFAPRQGDTFAFLSSGSMTGSFANVKLHDLAPGFQFELQPQAGGAVALVALNDAVSSRIPGDANDDGKVDFTDLLTLAQHYNQTAAYSQGDFNLDGTVGFDDLLTLAQHYGQVSTSPADLTFAAVPEPSAVACVSAALLSLCHRRRARV